MKWKLATACFLVGTFLVPVLAIAAESDQDRSSPRAFAKDALITTKIKAKLAEEKLSTMTRINVDTDKNGVVELSGTVANKEEMDKAVSIARGVDGVVSVNSQLKIANARSQNPSTGSSTPK